MMSGRILIVLFSMCSFSARAMAADVTTITLPVVDGQGPTIMSVHANAPLDKPNQNIKHAIVMLHGTGDDGLNWAKTLNAIAARLHVGASTLIVAPWFQDPDSDALRPSDQVQWPGGWAYGLRSQSSPGVTSFAVIDKIVDMLADRQRFPKLTKIVIAGFSAGGQATHRYGIIGKALPRAEAAGITIGLVVGASRTYTYFSDQRVQANGTLAAADLSKCDDANDWPYGLTSMPSYLPTLSADEIAVLQRAYLARKPLYLMGANDNADDSGNGCGEAVEGASRRGRLENYAKYLESLGDHPYVLIVPGIAHSGKVFDGKAQEDARFN
jgi:pimeloyl-ACP methyl ester carboxylesterase